MDPSTLLTNPDVGGLHGPPVLGQKGPIERMLRLDWTAVNQSQLSRFLELAVLLLAIVVAGVLFWLDRKEKGAPVAGARTASESRCRCCGPCPAISRLCCRDG